MKGAAVVLILSVVVLPGLGLLVLLRVLSGPPGGEETGDDPPGGSPVDRVGGGPRRPGPGPRTGRRRGGLLVVGDGSPRRDPHRGRPPGSAVRAR